MHTCICILGVYWGWGGGGVEGKEGLASLVCTNKHSALA